MGSQNSEPRGLGGWQSRRERYQQGRKTWDENEAMRSELQKGYVIGKGTVKWIDSHV